MNSSVSKFKTQKCIEWETNQENLTTNKILNSQKQCQNTKLSNSVKVITTERDISFPQNQDKEVTTIDDAEQRRESLAALCTNHLNTTDDEINVDSERKTSIKLQVCNPETNYSNSPIDHVSQSKRDENNALKDVDISNNNIDEYTGRNKIHNSPDILQINTRYPGTNAQNKLVNESRIVSEKIKASTIILNGKCSIENRYLDLELGTALNHRKSYTQDQDVNLRNSSITTNFINSKETAEISEKNLSNVHSFPNTAVNFISHTNTTVDEATKFQERVNKLQNDFFVNRYETINDIITNCNDDNVHKSLNQRDNSKRKPAVCSTVKVLAQEEYDSVKLKELRIHKPQLIGIVCNQTSNKTAVQSNQQNRGQTSEIRISVLNDVRVQSDILDFGECSANTSTTGLQENDINECYNVKLDAPEEVIVAGFHDFCHTMLSLEESIEMQDTRTLLKNSKKLETSIEVNTTKTRKEVMGSAHSIKQQSEITNLTRSVTELHVSAHNYSTSQYSSEITENASNKFEEDNQNNKLLDKMNIKDPDVIDAITVLDKSLMEASEQTPILFRESEMNTNATNIKQEASDTKNTSKIIREDKIQCDNLIEELMLEDSKRVSRDPTSHPSSPAGRIAVTISNMSSQRFFDYELDQKIKLGKKELTYQQNVESHNSRNDDINEANYSCLKVNKLTKEEMKNFSRTSTNTNELSNFDAPDNEIKRVSEMCSVKDDSLSLPASITSEDTNAGFTLQVTEENNPAHCIQDVVACNRTSPCSVDSGTSSHNQGYFVVVAIDFGTTYSGYAFSFTRDPDNIHMMK
ncbi:Heat shock protein 12A, partial [Stegodyphus mimosarum]